MLKDVAGTGGLKVLSMYVRTFGYDMSTVFEMKGPTDTFATIWAVKMLNSLGFSDIILQCDPEPSLIKWQNVSNLNEQNEKSFEVLPDHHIRATQESKTTRNSCRYRCAQCWQHYKSAQNTDQPLTAPDEMDCSTCCLAHSSCSFFVMPMPESSMVMVEFVLLG